MSLLKYNNFLPSTRSLFSDLIDMDNFFGSDLLSRELASNIPAVNVKEDENQFNIQLAAPGFEKKDFKVSIDNGVLNISGEKKEEKEEEKEDYKRREFNYSSFSRSFTLPKSVKDEEVKAEYKDGILSLNIPKKEEAKKMAKKEISIL